jgi:hypothetical protein
MSMRLDRNIWTVAVWLVAKHGEAAPKVVSARIAKLREGTVEKSAISSWLQARQLGGLVCRRCLRREALSIPPTLSKAAASKSAASSFNPWASPTSPVARAKRRQ